MVTTRMMQGMSTLEIVIAFAILIISLTALISVVFGNQSVSVDTETNTEALGFARGLLENERALAEQDFSSVISIPTTTVQSQKLPYDESITVSDITECKKQAQVDVDWATTTLRLQHVQLTTFLTSITDALALGGDCPADGPIGGWNPPALFASDTINPGKFTALDALQKIIYLASDDHAPYFYIADTRNTRLGDSHNHNPSIISFSNTFNASGDVIDGVEDIDSATIGSDTYAFAALASTTAQLAVLKATDIYNPTLIAKRSLAGVTALDSTAWGWREYYYDGKLYITARETAGPELHIFDVTDPAHPIEVGHQELNTTVNDFTVRDGLAYFAVSSDTRGPLLVYDVSDPAHITEVTGARGNITGSANGLSIYLLGNHLYLGRQKNVIGKEFYILDASDPKHAIGGLPILGPNDTDKELNADITGIRVSGRYAFIASYSNSSSGFKVFDIADPADIKPIYLSFNFGNKPVSIDYGNGFIYSGGESTPNFQILYSPN